MDPFWVRFFLESVLDPFGSVLGPFFGSVLDPFRFRSDPFWIRFGSDPFRSVLDPFQVRPVLDPFYPTKARHDTNRFRSVSDPFRLVTRVGPCRTVSDLHLRVSERNGTCLHFWTALREDQISHIIKNFLK